MEQKALIINPKNKKFVWMNFFYYKFRKGEEIKIIAKLTLI